MSRILMFAPYFPPHIGGLETCAAELSEELTRLGHTVAVITTALPKAQQPSGALLYTILRFPAFELVNNFPIMYPTPAIPGQYDIVLSHTRFFTTSLQAYWYARQHDVPWIHIEHGSWFVSVSNPVTSLVARLYDYTVGAFILGHSAKTIAISHAVASFIKRFDQRSTSVIYRGIDQSRIDTIPAFMPPEIDTNGKIILTTASRLFAWKGLDQSIQAILSLPPAVQEKIVYLIVGDGEDMARLRALAKPPVYLVGELPYEQAIGVLKKAAIYIHPAHKGGGLSTALIEALYCQCAAVATPNEGASEVVFNNHTGLLVADHQPSKLGEALVRLIEDSALRDRLAQAGQRFVRGHFSWNKNAAAFSEIVEQEIQAYAHRHL